MKKHFLIYQITNNINGMIYIGKHETFKIDDDYFGSGTYINNAIKKYGIENFTKTILFECQNAIEMNLLEEAVVTEDFCKRCDTYNIQVGGKGGNPLIGMSDVDIKHMKNKCAIAAKKLTFEQRSLALKNSIKKNGFWWNGRKHSEETKAKMRTSRYDGHGKNNSMFGKMWICNDLTKESKSILKTDPIPNGWRKGRICKK